MKKLYVLALALIISAPSFAGLTDVYNAINSNPDSSASKIDQKAAGLKNKIDSKLIGLQAKTAEKSAATLSSQESLKAKLEEKLAGLVANGEEKSSKADELRAEIESLTKLIEAAKK